MAQQSEHVTDPQPRVSCESAVVARWRREQAARQGDAGAASNGVCQARGQPHQRGQQQRAAHWQWSWRLQSWTYWSILSLWQSEPADPAEGQWPAEAAEGQWHSQDWQVWVPGHWQRGGETWAPGHWRTPLPSPVASDRESESRCSTTSSTRDTDTSGETLIGARLRAQHRRSLQDARWAIDHAWYLARGEYLARGQQYSEGKGNGKSHAATEEAGPE